RTGTAPNSASIGSDAQWLVARRPASRPAAASTNEPVHTEVTQRAPAACARTNSRTTSSVSTSKAPCPPGTSSRSAWGASSKLTVGTIDQPPSHRTGSVVRHASCSSTSGSDDNTCAGPVRSNCVRFGNSRATARNGGDESVMSPVCTAGRAGPGADVGTRGSGVHLDGVVCHLVRTAYAYKYRCTVVCRGADKEAGVST